MQRNPAKNAETTAECPPNVRSVPRSMIRKYSGVLLRIDVSDQVADCY